MSAAKKDQSAAKKDQSAAKKNQYILIVEPTSSPGSAEVIQFGGPKQISPEVLGQKLKEFADGLSASLQSLQAIGGAYQLAEISLEAALDASFGFALIAKAGVKGSVTLKFSRAT
jgi:hypothetical protein